VRFLRRFNDLFAEIRINVRPALDKGVSETALVLQTLEAYPGYLETSERWCRKSTCETFIYSIGIVVPYFSQPRTLTSLRFFHLFTR
jgi:hypothetical protein